MALRLILPAEDKEFFLGDLQESGYRSWYLEIWGALPLRLSAGLGSRKRDKLKGDGMLHELLIDLKLGLRLMRRWPGFTLVALVIMALGIGANTAMFGIMNGVLLKALPYPEPDRIVLLMETNPSQGWDTFSVSPLNFWDWQEQSSTIELMAAYQRNSTSFTNGEHPESLSVYRVSEHFMEILGADPLLGRGIRREDLDPSNEAVVVLSHGLWMRSFGGEPSVLGRAMVLDGVAHTIVGVLPQSWRPFSRRGTDLILPLRPQPFWHTNRSSHFLYGLGRLQQGVSVEQAQSDMSAVAAALEQAYPDSNTGWGARVRPLNEAMVGSSRLQLVILMTCVCLVLLIVCANLANMTLARTLVRKRELAIRAAVGAGRARVVRQLLTESFLLAAIGGVLGVGLAHISLRAFVAHWPSLLPRMQEIRIDATVALFSLGLLLISGLLFGLLPALGTVGSNLLADLRKGGTTIGRDASRGWIRAALVVSEVGLAVMLLVGTGLLLQSLAALEAVDPGFAVENRLVFSTPLPRVSYTNPEQIRGFGEAALQSLGALPGVESVALTSLYPLSGDDNIWGFWKEHSIAEQDTSDGFALFYRVSPGYLETMGIPLLAGRDISPDDREDGLPVVVISRSLAEQQFPGVDPVGKHIRFGRDEDDPLVEIVGVAEDIHHYTLLRSSLPQVYVPFSQRPTRYLSFVIRAAAEPLSLVEQLRGAIVTVDADQPVVGVRTADLIVSDSISMPRLRSFLMTGFGLTALLLAVVGLYGVMAYNVSRRTREIGVRIALGATRGSVLSLVFREGARLVGLGLVIGLTGALCLAQALESLLFQVGAHDPAVFVAVPLLLITVAFLAMVIPAGRAAGVDPARTLGAD
jgi:putative ABC transport system permease protein